MTTAHVIIAEGAHPSSSLVGLAADLADRADAGATGSTASNVITDTAILAADGNRLVVPSASIPPGAYVGAITAGTSFQLVDAAGTALLPLATVAGITLKGGYSITELENRIPQVEAKFHDDYTFVKYVISVVGTIGTPPTSWSLGARFEQRVEHTQGFQFQFPIWAPLQPEQISAHVVEGVNWYGPGMVPPQLNNNNYMAIGSPSLGPVPADSFGIVATSAMIADDGSGVLPSGLVIPANGTIDATVLTARITVSRVISQALGHTSVRLQPYIVGGDSTTRIILTAICEGFFS